PIGRATTTGGGLRQDAEGAKAGDLAGADARLDEDRVGVLAERRRAGPARAGRRREADGGAERREAARTRMVFLDEQAAREHLRVARDALEVVHGHAEHVALLEPRHPRRDRARAKERDDDRAQGLAVGEARAALGEARIVDEV